MYGYVEGIKRVEIQSLAPPSEEGGQGGVNGGAVQAESS
jgi:hypothetical protein